MIAGCVPYRIEAELQGENVPPNLLHLEEELKKIGYCCKTSLKDLKMEKLSFRKLNLLLFVQAM